MTPKSDETTPTPRRRLADWQDGTLHVAVCNANPNGPVGGPGCSCKLGREIKQWKARALEAEAALQSRASQDWQPIETAPTSHGMYIVAYQSSFRRGSWDAPLETEHRVTVLFWSGEWNYLGANGRTGFAYHVTHWMPLPSPPSIKETTSDATTETYPDGTVRTRWELAPGAKDLDC